LGIEVSETDAAFMRIERTLRAVDSKSPPLCFKRGATHDGYSEREAVAADDAAPLL
jgi:hypothetical protein